ncbi:hypothetical protein Bbelb_282150 [Branchiostoma belcheri]|nr:hypothetical protein Bbelb_282150 [Branchiostoma belcheri]
MTSFFRVRPCSPSTSGLRSSSPPPSKTRRGEAPRIPAGLCVRGDRGYRGVEPVERRAVAEQFSGTVEATSPEMQDGCPTRPLERGIAIRCNPRLVCCSGLMELSIRWTTKKKKSSEAEEAAKKNDARTLYRIVRELTGTWNSSSVPVKDKSGKTLLTTEEQDLRWMEHFQEPIRREETAEAIKALKNNKAAGLDEISAEMLKHGGESTVEMLTRLMNRCWQEGQVPRDWQDGVIVKLPKKGDLSDCNNWRGITLLSIPGKVFCAVLLRRLKKAVGVLTQRQTPSIEGGTGYRSPMHQTQAGHQVGTSCYTSTRLHSSLSWWGEGPQDRSRLTISVYNTQVETVDQFTYLGSVLSNSGEVEPDISCRLGKAAAVFRRMRTIWATSAIDLDTKLRLYNSIVLPTAIYASETWKCTAKLTKKLDVFHQRNLRRILKVRWQDHITNEEILRRAKTQPLGDIITGKRMQLAGHILRLPSQRHSKTAMTWMPPGGRRKRGRPKNTWRRTFQEDLKRANIAWEEAEEAAATRTRWKLAAQCACRHRRT